MNYVKKGNDEIPKSVKAILAPEEIVELSFGSEVEEFISRAVFTNRRIIVSLKEGKKKALFEVIPYRSISHYHFKTNGGLKLYSNTMYTTTTGTIDTEFGRSMKSGVGSFGKGKIFTFFKKEELISDLAMRTHDFSVDDLHQFTVGKIESETHSGFAYGILKFSKEDIDEVLVVLAKYVY